MVFHQEVLKFDKILQFPYSNIQDYLLELHRVKHRSFPHLYLKEPEKQEIEVRQYKDMNCYCAAVHQKLGSHQRYLKIFGHPGVPLMPGKYQ